MTHLFETASDGQWYVVLTKPKQEQRALQNLQQQGFEAFLPCIKKEVLRKNTLQQIQEPLFKRYLFIFFNESTSPWHLIRHTLGVTELVKFGGKLATLNKDIITALKEINHPEKTLYTAGDLLTVTDGTFKGLEVIFSIKDSEQRALVLIEMLNKTQHITIDFHALKKVN